MRLEVMIPELVSCATADHSDGTRIAADRSHGTRTMIRDADFADSIHVLNPSIRGAEPLKKK